MPRIITWNEDQAKRELTKRLAFSRDQRSKIEYRWEESERAVYSTRGHTGSPSINDIFEVDNDYEPDNSNSELSVNYTFKNLRFIHAQLSANPPSVVTRPTSNDQDDRKKADAADRLVRYALRQYKMQERIDRAALNCLLYGTGFIKTIWDSNRGDIIEMYDDGEMELEGDISISVPSTWNIYIDPDADSWEDTRYVFERVYIPFEEALFQFGTDKRELLESCRIKTNKSSDSQPGVGSSLEQDKYDAVEVYEYWERGLPTNGYLGRYCICTKRGELLTPVGPNPFRFRQPGAVSEIEINEKLSEEERERRIERLPMIAKLPYHIFTDIDVPDRIWGRSFIEYASKLQDVLNRLDSTTLDNIQAHGVNRLVLPEGAEIADDSLTNTPWDVVKLTGNQGPWFVEAPRAMPIVDNFRVGTKQGIDDMSGVNEAMMGQQSREQSGFSMQYATNQGNMIRRRLFNKYVQFVEDIYKAYLNIIRKHWSVPRTITVLGKEKALEAVDVKGMDIDGGFDIVVEYGASLSLDPMTRREEILSLQPMFQQAGVPPRVMLKLLKLNELEGLYDMMQLAEDRQREIFEEMIATGRYIEPRKLQDHENMMAYSLQYIMTTEFKYLEEEAKILIEKHIEDRAAMAAAEKAPANPAGSAGMPPGPAGAPGPLPAGPEMVGAQAGMEAMLK